MRIIDKIKSNLKHLNGSIRLQNAQKEIEFIKKHMSTQNLLLQNSLSSVNAKIKSQATSKSARQNISSFILFKYHHRHINITTFNLGDDIQTIATKNAIDKIFPNSKYEYFDRDFMSFYNGGGDLIKPIAIMQGWFARGYDFLPNNNLQSVFVGTHFTFSTQQFIKYFLSANPHYFTEIGCRDRFTLDFCANLGIKSYFSRCLTLSLDKRTKEQERSAKKVFFVNVPADLMQFFPATLKQDSEFVNQQVVKMSDIRLDDCFSAAENLLERYKNEARLVITTALHCASPCVAMGIPVILIKTKSEQDSRFSALDGIIKIHNISDLKNGNIDFNPKAPNIEELKCAIIENLKLSVLEKMGENINKTHLACIRNTIDAWDSNVMHNNA